MVEKDETMQNVGFLTIQILLAIVGLSIGLFFFLKPRLTIEVQRRFYAKINWKIEPVSMQKEIRNTKIMGIFLMIIVLVIICLEQLS